MDDYNERMKSLLGDEWYEYLKEDINSDYFKKIGSFLSTERFRTVVFPTKDETFNAYKLTQPSQIKVIILGQDPYSKKGEGHGLAFSLKEELLRPPPSLQKIAKSIEDSIYNQLNLSWDNNLTRWTEQGVFLLNKVLTVEKEKPLSHYKIGWEIFTKKTIQIISMSLNNCVFLLFGKEAQSLCTEISDNHLIIKCEHPAASSYQKREWQFNDCWNKTNNYLIQHNKTPIIW